jgi:hypothetical protein
MPNQKSSLHEDNCKHIFTASAALLGVCLTVIGLLRVVIAISKVGTLADDIVSVDALLFLAACLSSYWALRTRNIRRMHRTERMADRLFIAGLCVMAGVCVFITYAVSAL